MIEVNSRKRARRLLIMCQTFNLFS